ncbi:phage tail fiber protein [Psychrobacter sp. AOP7-C1-14]|uniref:phage tail fiber protein n=1 Tax=Psychrobacter sp. AOP7-C1-14 TaxID=3457640 RepID=UPI00402BBDD0
MTIQVPNPGTGNGATGDNEFVLWSKVKDNFNNQTNAASREVGSADANLPNNTLLWRNTFGLWRGEYEISGTFDLNLAAIDKYYLVSKTNTSYPAKESSSIALLTSMPATRSTPTDYYFQFLWGRNNGTLSTRVNSAGTFTSWNTFYSTANTTLDSNGAIKPSSPVLRVFSDRIEGNDDGDSMSATYIKNGIGDYTITGTTGLRSDGWYIVIPNDMNGNPKVAVTLDDTDDVITLKTYARIFDMSTFKFVPDLNQPLDIPDGRWIDLRFNDVEIDDSDHVEV